MDALGIMRIRVPPEMLRDAFPEGVLSGTEVLLRPLSWTLEAKSADLILGSACRYGGHIVAKLPFEPFTLLAKLAHRGITSPAVSDCSVVSNHLLYYSAQCTKRRRVYSMSHWHSCAPVQLNFGLADTLAVKQEYLSYLVEWQAHISRCGL